GLITSVRDQIIKRDEKKGADVIADKGVDDKRLLLIEAEFARPLRVMLRPENILSTILRAAWDGDRLENRTKHSPEKATGAHISLMGPITPDELLQEMDDVSPCNGFGNRFLYCCSRRSKMLPFGGRVDRRIMETLQERIKEAVDRCPSGEIPFDEAARELWREQYPLLTAPRLGMFGAITMRGAAQTVRLALIYTLLDSQQFIGAPQLEAALEVWRYAEAGARMVFGDRVGDRVADTVLAALRRVGARGLARTEIYRLYNGRIPASRIDAALIKLSNHKLAREARVQTGGR